MPNKGGRVNNERRALNFSQYTIEGGGLIKRVLKKSFKVSKRAELINKVVFINLSVSKNFINSKKVSVLPLL